MNSFDTNTSKVLPQHGQHLGKIVSADLVDKAAGELRTQIQFAYGVRLQHRMVHTGEGSQDFETSWIKSVSG